MADTVQSEQWLQWGAQPAEAGRERIIVQCTPGGGGADASPDELWGIVDLAPPRQAWPCQNGKDVAVWVATEYRTGVVPGLRLLLRGDAFTIAEVVCLHQHRPGMWLRVVRGDRAGGRVVRVPGTVT